MFFFYTSCLHLLYFVCVASHIPTVGYDFCTCTYFSVSLALFIKCCPFLRPSRVFVGSLHPYYVLRMRAVWVCYSCVRVGTRDRILYYCSRVFRCAWVACVWKCDLGSFGGNFGTVLFCLMLIMFVIVF